MEIPRGRIDIEKIREEINPHEADTRLSPLVTATVEAVLEPGYELVGEPVARTRGPGNVLVFRGLGKPEKDVYVGGTPTNIVVCDSEAVTRSNGKHLPCFVARDDNPEGTGHSTYLALINELDDWVGEEEASAR